MSGVYVHIPFCRTRCTYCGFYSELPHSAQDPETFTDALCKEIDLDASCSPGNGCQPSGTDAGVADTLYFGGGTPSLLSPGQIERIAGRLGGKWEEFTVELNPDDIVNGGSAYAGSLKRLGVNRASMGVQSTDGKVLKRMGRRHDAADAVRAFSILREAGFDNISLDFIFGFVSGFNARELGRFLTSLPGGPPEHLSCYQLVIEEGSGLEKMIAKGLYSQPDDNECERQYMEICGVLRDCGYEHYEISNWALPGRRSRHNSSYWNHSPYTGFGPGAHSLITGTGTDGTTKYVRRWNKPGLQAYAAAAASGDFGAIREEETLTGTQVKEERIMLGLRTCDGAAAESLPDNVAVKRMIDEGVLAPSGPGRMRIPEERWFVSDDIISEIFKYICTDDN